MYLFNYFQFSKKSRVCQIVGPVASAHLFIIHSTFTFTVLTPFTLSTVLIPPLINFAATLRWTALAGQFISSSFSRAGSAPLWSAGSRVMSQDYGKVSGRGSRKDAALAG